MKHTAIVLTGGSGQRIKELDYPKQFCEIGEKPVFIHSLEIYEQMDRINDIYLVINADYAKKYQDILEKYKISKLQTLVDGGETRQDSVENALTAIEQTDIIILHDGANPTTRADFVNECIDAVRQYGASSGCVATRDTVVRTNNNEIDRVLKRDSLAYICSPQVYRFELIQKAFFNAKKNNITDQPTLELMKKIGQKVVLVPCPHNTVKITQLEDIYLAEQMLSRK